VNPDSPIRLADFFSGAAPRAVSRGGLCEVSHCSHLAFVSIRITRQRRQLCLSHYEALSHAFGRDRIEQRPA